MTNRIAATLAILASLNGCAAVPALTAVGALTGGITGVWNTYKEVAAETAAAITQACHEWDIVKATTQTRMQLQAVQARNFQKISLLTAYANAVCDPRNPPPGDPIGTAIWLGGIIAEIAILTGEKPNPVQT